VANRPDRDSPDLGPAHRDFLHRHLGDPGVPWQLVKAQRNADGSESYVHEKWLAFSPDPPYLSLYARYDPGMVVRRHGHLSPHVVFVIAGELTCGEIDAGYTSDRSAESIKLI
jgi:hypothetical protein